MIRPAVHSDVQRMVDMGSTHLADSTYNRLECDNGKISDFIHDLIDSDGFVVVIEREKKIVGAMLGDVVLPWFSSSKVGIEYIIYVDKEHRSGKDTLKMVQSFINWCKLQECEQIRPEITSGNRSLSRLYQACGFIVVGQTFCMNC